VEIISSNPVDQAQNVAGTTSGTSTASISGQPPPRKKRRLTPAQKEQQQKEKDAKAAEKAEQKAKKDEEKHIKDEERRKKAEEVEAKKREKALEKERKEQEKLKKERAQMRLGVWFQKPATPIKDPVDGEDVVNTGTARRRSLSLSLEPFDAVADQIRRSESPCKTSAAPKPGSKMTTPAKPAVSDYNKYFLPFQLQSYCSMPPLTLPDDAEAAQDAFDHCVNDPSIREKYDLGIVDSYASLEQQFAKERHTSRGHPLPNMRQLADHIQGTLGQPIDLTTDEESRNPMDALQSVPRRYLEFHEDVRPAYFGTYTKIRSPRTSKRLSRNPFSRTRTDTDYDYDSEAEWEEPEEGEEILDEEEDEAESIGDVHEMDEFLDDEDDAMKSKRKMITGDLAPTSTGLCWEDESGKIQPSIEGAIPSQAMRDMRIGVLLPGFSGATIDPFSTAYWDFDSSTAPSSVPAGLQPQGNTTIPDNGHMPPPTRAPLQPRPVNNISLDHMLVGAAEGMKGPINSVAATQSSKPGRKPTPKSLSKEDLDEFKEAVVGSQVSKADLLKGLKAR
jgi:chromatin assembly factor 1 subunit A